MTLRTIVLLTLLVIGSVLSAQTVQQLVDSSYKMSESKPWLAKKLSNKAVEITEGKNDAERGLAVYSAAMISYSTGEKDKALSYFIECMRVAEGLGDKQKMAECYSMVGELTNTNFGDKEEAIKYHYKAMEIYKEQDNPKGIAFVYNDIGIVYDSLDFHYKSLAIDLKHNHVHGIADSYHNIASIYEKRGKLDSALHFFNLALDVDLEHNGAWEVSTSYQAVGRVLVALGKYEEAQESLAKGIIVAKKGGYKEALTDLYKQMSFIEEQRGNFERSNYFLKLYTRYHDSLIDATRLNAVANAMAQFDAEKKDLLNAQLEQENALKDSKLANERYVNIGLVAGLLIIASIAVLILRGYREKQRTNLLLDAKNTEILDSITYAKRIQQAILPPDRLLRKHLPAHFVLYKPKDIVAGDFYWMEAVGDTVVFAAADCTGHGVPGAMVSVVCHNALNRSIKEFKLIDPAEILDKTRELVIEQFAKSEEDVMDGMDIALCTLQEKELRFAGANNPLWLVRNGVLEEYKGNKQPIGKYHFSQPFDTHIVQLEHGDQFYVFSDGYADQFGGEKGKKFKSRGLKELITRISSMELSAQKIELERSFETWRGDLAQLDDVCMIGVRV